MNLNFLKEQPQTLDAAFRRTRLLHVAFLSAPFIYAIIAFLMTRFAMVDGEGFVPLDESTYQLLYLATWIIFAVVALLVFFVLPRFFSPMAVVKRHKDARDIDFFEKLEKGHFSQISWLNFVTIAAFTLFLFNGNLLNFLPFPAASLLILLFRFPRRQEWEEAGRQRS